MDLDRIKALIRKHEGCPTVEGDPNTCKPYLCSQGKVTIGYGYNLEAHGFTPAEAWKVRWPIERAEKELGEELRRIFMGLNAYWSWWNDLDDVRQAAMVSMAYVLGISGLAKWKNTLRAMEAGRWEEVAQALLGSLWQKQLLAAQKGKRKTTRVEILAEMFRSGRWPG